MQKLDFSRLISVGSLLLAACFLLESGFSTGQAQQADFCSELNQAANGSGSQTANGSGSQTSGLMVNEGLITKLGTPKSGPRAVEDLNVNTLPTIKVDNYTISFNNAHQTEIGKDVRCLAVKLARDQCKGDLKIISGYRSPENNGAVSGAKDSMHMYRRAIDFSCGGKSSPELAKMAEAVGCAGVGTYCGGTSHCDTRNQKTAWNWCGSAGILGNIKDRARSAYDTIFNKKMDEH